VARDKDQQSERDPQHEQTMRARDRQAGSPEAGDRSAGDADWSIERQEPRGFFGRASERRSHLRSRPSSQTRDEPSSGAWELGDESRGYSSGEAGDIRGRGPDEPGQRGTGDYGGRSTRGYGRPDAGRGSSSGGFYGQGTGELEREERGYSNPRGGETAREREIRQARSRDAGPYPESRMPHRQGLPSDLRAGEGDWTQAGGYAELPRDRGGYEARYQQGEWTPGGDASVPLHMGYGDFGVRSQAPRRGRWKREPVLARDIMTSNPASVRPESTLREVAKIMRDENTGIVPVCSDNGTLLGVVTDRDIVMRTLASDESPTNAAARDVMTDDVEAVTPDEELHDVVRLMGDRQVRRVPVVEREDRLVGIISMADVATRADYDEDLQEALEEISARRSFWSRLFGG
jgi:CBS domain-containing protein